MKRFIYLFALLALALDINHCQNYNPSKDTQNPVGTIPRDAAHGTPVIAIWDETTNKITAVDSLHPLWVVFQETVTVLPTLSTVATSTTVDSVALTATSATISNANSNRLSEILTNFSNTKMYVAFDTKADSISGFWLAANGGTLTYGLATNMPYTGVVTARADSGSTKIMGRVKMSK